MARDSIEIEFVNVAYPNFKLSPRDGIFAHSRETIIDIDFLSYDPRNKDISYKFTELRID